MIGPMPGTLIRRSQPASWRATISISADSPSMRSSRWRQSPARPSMIRTIHGDRTSGGVARMRGSSARKKRCPCRTAMIDDAGALADQSLAHTVQRLQVELIRGLRRHELHRRPLHRFGNRLRIPEVVLLSLRIGAYILRRHQPGVVAELLQLTAEM